MLNWNTLVTFGVPAKGFDWKMQPTNSSEIRKRDWISRNAPADPDLLLASKLVNMTVFPLRIQVRDPKEPSGEPNGRGQRRQGFSTKPETKPERARPDVMKAVSFCQILELDAAPVKFKKPVVSLFGSRCPFLD